MHYLKSTTAIEEMLLHKVVRTPVERTSPRPATIELESTVDGSRCEEMIHGGKPLLNLIHLNRAESAPI